MKRCIPAAALIFGMSGLLSPALAEEVSDRFIVRISSGLQQAAASRPAQVQQALQLAKRAGINVTHWRRMGLGAEVLKLSRPIPLSQARILAARIGLQEGVDWAVPSQRRYAVAVPNDPEFEREYTLQELTATQGATAAAQIINDFGLIPHLWYLAPVQPTGDFKTLAMSINWMPAWERTLGFSNASYRSVVAVIDTGIVSHRDLAASRVLSGFDFIHDSPTARDGNGRDSNARDEGDWNSSSECERSDSSWHGTFVAGIIGATANNGVDLAGINPAAAILPIRVLGKCGGYDEDIIDGALWAGGVAMQNGGLGALPPLNADPAGVVNFSLGGIGECTPAYVSMVNALRAAGVVVVAAAGNSRENVNGFAPANCPGVISVSSNSRAGALADYSNFGNGVTLSAPGGGTTFKVTSTSNAGMTIPGADSVAQERGTSFAAPMIAGAASLLQAINPALTPDQVMLTLQQSASAFPSGVDCSVSVCGAGILNVDNAMLLAETRLLASKSLLRFSKGLGGDVMQQRVTVTNRGAAALVLGTASIVSTSGAAGDFSLLPGCSGSLGAGSSCALTVNFAPVASGGRYAVLQIPVADAVLRVALYGTNAGVVLTASPAGGLSFSASSGEVSTSKAVSFTNSSAQALSFYDNAINLPAGFIRSSMVCDETPVTSIGDCLLPPGGVVVLNIAFAPSSSGDWSGNVTLKPVEGSAATLALQGTAGSGGAIGAGGGCTVARGHGDISLLLLPALLWLRRRRR